MLQIINVSKKYIITNELSVNALKEIFLNLRKSEFVSVLGPSGCGKTTLLNIIGGLDRYNEGDILINGKSTKDFSDSDWDAYRNQSIGFVFQSYNLIPHMNILDNVALALSVAGESRAIRTEKAKAALDRVGLSQQLKKFPNQLSGGQTQRVAIARAIVNNPDIILADEPTGALDSETGVQVMELLKEISRERLVVLVTHNSELAEAYSTRIVRMTDGRIISDSNPYTEEERQDGQILPDGVKAEFQNASTDTGNLQNVESDGRKVKRGKNRKKHMPLTTALCLAAKKLKTKLGRAFLTSFAGSIGIFGIALVLAISGGMSDYVSHMQTEAVGDSAIRLGESAYSLSRILSVMEEESGANNTPYPDTDCVFPYRRQSFSSTSTLSDEFISYVQNVDKSWIKAINYNYSVQMHVLQQNDGAYTLRSNWSDYAYQMIDEDELIEDNYNVLYKLDSSETGYPNDMTEISLVVDKFNRISPNTLNAIGIPYTNADGSYRQVYYNEIVGKEYVLVLNDGWYLPQSDGTFKALASKNYKDISDTNTVKLKIVSILRAKNNGSTLWLNSGLAYLPELSQFLVENARNSQIGQAQISSTDKNVLTGSRFDVYIPGTKEEENAQILSQYNQALKDIGAYTVPTSIQIYPKDIKSKQHISDYIEAWNKNHPESEVTYLDLTDLALNMLSEFINIVSYALIAFSAVALIVSTVMISVITYTSVVERIKEIGVLRSMGARKRDIANLFNAETFLIGFFAGLMGVVLAVVAGTVINFVTGMALNVLNLVKFSWGIVLGMLALSVALTLLAGLIPAIIAAKKDPVTCLRTE